MRHNVLGILKLLVLLVFTLMSGCTSIAQDTRRPLQERDISGINSVANLVIFFRKDATRVDVNRFWGTVLGIPQKKASAFDLKPGISGVSAGPAVDGHDSVYVSFWSFATQDEVSRVISDVNASPHVYRVFTDTVPASIESLQ